MLRHIIHYFVVRDNISRNIIIDNGTAKPAKNLKEVREVLGIKVSDNLINSKYVLVVEGVMIRNH